MADREAQVSQVRLCDTCLLVLTVSQAEESPVHINVLLLVDFCFSMPLRPVCTVASCYDLILISAVSYYAGQVTGAPPSAAICMLSASLTMAQSVLYVFHDVHYC